MQFDISKLSLVGLASDACRRLEQRGIPLARSYVAEILAGLLGYGKQSQMDCRTFELNDPLYDFLFLAEPQVAILDQYVGERRVRELSATKDLPHNAQRSIVDVCAETLKETYPQSVFFDGHSFAGEYVIPFFTPLIARSEAVRAVEIETGEPGDMLIETIDVDFGWSIRRTKDSVWRMQFGGLLGREGADRGEDANLAQAMFRATFEFPKIGPALISSQPYVLVEAWSHYPRDYRMPPREAQTYESAL